eukprot:gene29103-36092_t
MSSVNKIYADKVRDFSLNLVDSLVDDLDATLNDVQAMFKEAKRVFRKNSDICRLSEHAVSHSFSSLKRNYELIVASNLEEVS